MKLRILYITTGLLVAFASGFYVFWEGLRRRGYDMTIWQAALELGCVIGLVSVLLGGIALVIYGIEKK